MNLADETTGILNTDQVAVIFSFLAPKDIMCARVCISWRDAAKKTIVPLTDFCVDSVDTYRAIVAMTTALPNLQQLTLCNLGWGDKYTDGQDPDEEWAAFTADDTAHNIDIVSNFSHLRSLEIENAPLNGRYPALFNIPLLQKLKITCYELKWDLGMLEGLPSLKELDCCNWSCNPHVIGNLGSLRVLRDTLVKVKIIDCRRVEGNFMALADFPHLKELNLRDTNVTGDIRDIRRHDFPALKYLYLPKSVIGGNGYKFQHIPDNQEMTELMHAIHLLLKRIPTMFGRYDLLSPAFFWRLSEESPGWYSYDRERGSPEPPFLIQFVQAGSRRGWSWCTWSGHHSCEINWLDPEPSSDSSDYEVYTQDLQRIERRVHFYFYRGFHQPPTEEEYRRLCGG